MKTCFSSVEELGEMGRFGASVIDAGSPRASRAHEGVFSVEMNLLRRGWPVGERVGTLPHAKKALGLGRRAFREAMTILEARGLLITRSGPGGGLFVGAPTLEDVATALLMYLAQTGARPDCVSEFRQAVWRVVIAEATRLWPLPSSETPPGEWGFAVDLAGRLGNGAMEATARLAEMLAQLCGEPAAPRYDEQIVAALRSGNLYAALKRLDVLGQSNGNPGLVRDFGTAEQGSWLFGRKSPMALAVRMAQDLRDGHGVGEAEWETAERLGCHENVVRKARRILQDFDVLHCRQGIKGAEWAAPANDGSVVRVLAPFLVAGGMSATDNRMVAGLLAINAPIMAASRVAEERAGPVDLLAQLAPKDFVELMQFENLLLDLSGNPLLAIMIRAIGLANLFVDGLPPAPPMSPEIMSLNRRIVQAIQAGDVSTAGKAAMAKARILLAPLESDPAAA